MFRGCSSLTSGLLAPISSDISYENCSLGRQAILDIFSSLASDVTDQTIIIAGNSGVNDLIEDDFLIATNKGWIVKTVPDSD